MKTYQHNGEEWYIDARPLWMRVAQWLVSTGLDSPHWGPDGYTYRWRAMHKIRLSLRARGHPASAEGRDCGGLSAAEGEPL